MKKVCAVDTFNYDIEVVRESINNIFNLLEFDRLFDKNKKVVIKPNLLMKRDPSGATTTHPSIVQAIIERLQTIGVKDITIAESPAGLYTKKTLADIYKVTGIIEVSNNTKTNLNLDVGYKSIFNDKGVVCKRFNIINPICDADIIINVGKVKTHGMTTMSGSIKNLFGVVPGLQKPELHCKYNKLDIFSEMLIDLNECVKPTISIMDGVVCMEGNGPSGGNPKECNFIAASESQYNLDIFLSKKMGLKPDDIMMIKCASRRGLCNIDDMDEKIIGDEKALEPINDFKMPDSISIDFSNKVPKVLRRPANYLMNKVLVAKPVIKKNECVGCGKCEESCPQHTIKIINNKAHINYKNCIKCFCCQEMCQVKAIKIKRFIK